MKSECASYHTLSGKTLTEVLDKECKMKSSLMLFALCAAYAGLADTTEKVRLANRTKLYAKTISTALSDIRKCYAEGRRYTNPFLREQKGNPDWLSKWAAPRIMMSEADAQAGESVLAEFSMKHLPNAYANYKKKRDALIDLQQVFNEEFPEPWTINEASPKWNLFNKVLKKFVMLRTEYFLCYDELCHYWMLSRFGALDDKDFSIIDAKPLAVSLLPENTERIEFTLLKPEKWNKKMAVFAAKYAPACCAVYQKMEREFKEIDALIVEVSKQHVDIARFDRAFAAAISKRNDLVRELNALSLQLQTWHTDHRISEKSADDVAKCDAGEAKRLGPFVAALPTYIKEHAFGPVIDMVAIPKKNYSLQRTEVTQFQWMAIMGEKPVGFVGPDYPVINVSWRDCTNFIERASILDSCRYRLPYSQEMKYVCDKEISKHDYKKHFAYTHEIYFMDETRKKHNPSKSVWFSIPNSFSLCDLTGNVMEWTFDKEIFEGTYSLPKLDPDERRLFVGVNISSRREIIYRESYEYFDYEIGFRLAISRD